MKSLDELAQEYMDMFGKHPPMPVNVLDSELAKVLSESIKVGKDLAYNYDWYADLPDDAVT